MGDVRGLGLMIGIELVTDQKTKERAMKLRDEVVQMCFERGLLVLGAGPNSIRLCPPLVITKNRRILRRRPSKRCLTALGAKISRVTGNRSVPTDILLPHVSYRELPEAIDWLGRAFGFVEHYRYGDPVGGAQMHLGKAYIMLKVRRAGLRRNWATEHSR